MYECAYMGVYKLLYVCVFAYKCVWFDGISNIVVYLKPNLVYTNILNMICKHILLITFLNEPEDIFAHS